MDNIIQSDVFFFITSIVVALFGILILLLIIYSLVLFGRLRKVVRMMQREAEFVVEDIKSMRVLVKRFLGLSSSDEHNKKNNSKSK